MLSCFSLKLVTSMPLLMVIAETLLLAAGVFLLLWALLSPPFTMSVWNSFMFHPSPPAAGCAPDSIGAVRCREINFQTPDGEKLYAWFFAQPNAERTFLLSHGNSGTVADRMRLIQVLLSTGCSVFAYDYRGFGHSTGEPSVAGLKQDGLAAYDYLTDELKVAAERIILYGESMGTGVSCSISEKRPSAALVLQSGYSSLREAGEQIYPLLRLYPISLFANPNFDNVAVVRRPHPPLLIIHGGQDTLLPFAHAQRVFDKAVEPKTLVKLPEAAHNDLPDFPELAAALDNFLCCLEPAGTSTISGY